MRSSDLFNIHGIHKSAALLQDGLIYAAILSDEHFLPALVQGCLGNAAESGRPVWLISSGEPERLLPAAMLSEQTTGGEAGDEQCAILKLDVAALAAFAADSVRQLLDEISHFGAGRHSLLVMEHAELWFNREASGLAAQLAVLRDWAERNQSCFVFLFHNPDGQIQELVSGLIKSAHLFGGIGCMRLKDGAVNWEIINWHAVNAIHAGRIFRLDVDEAGQLCGYELAGAGEEQSTAADEEEVFAMESLRGTGQSQDGWHWCENLDELLQRTSSAVAATIILGFNHSLTPENIGRAVFRLRQGRGNRIKIVIRELNAHLRYSQEALMLKLGANLVVPTELGHSRFLNMVDMVQGQRYSRILPQSYEAAAGELQRQQEQGYLPPEKFITAVRRELEAGRMLSIQHALIGLPLTHGLSPLEALRYCTVKREGDYCTADEHGIYFFFSACREVDVGRTLGNCVQLPLGDLFSSEARYLSYHTIQAAIDDLDERLMMAAMPDYSAELEAMAGEGKPLLREPGEPLARHAASRARHAPPPARRHPLRLRTPAAVPDTDAREVTA